MLEWGCGNSSRWFSERVGKLYSIEHNKAWYDQIKVDLNANHKLIFAEEHEYASAGNKFEKKFDLILIDGIRRDDCCTNALSLLKENGLIILDNSERHPDLGKKLRDSDLIQIDFHGFGPINEYAWTTSIFLRRSVALKPLNIQPRVPIGGGL